MFQKILALVKAFESQDWVSVMTIVLSIMSGMKSGAIKPAEIADCHQLLKTAHATSQAKP